MAKIEETGSNCEKALHLDICIKIIIWGKAFSGVFVVDIFYHPVLYLGQYPPEYTPSAKGIRPTCTCHENDDPRAFPTGVGLRRQFTYTCVIFDLESPIDVTFKSTLYSTL
jgi:hypothetical protein